MHRYFPSSGTGITRPKKLKFRRKKETWLYSVKSERMPTGGGGLISIYRYDRVSPIAKAPFTDKAEEERLFGEIWNEVVMLTETTSRNLEEEGLLR